MVTPCALSTLVPVFIQVVVEENRFESRTRKVIKFLHCIMHLTLSNAQADVKSSLRSAGLMGYGFQLLIHENAFFF